MLQGCNIDSYGNACWANKEPFGTVVSPGCALVCLVMYHYFAACWGQAGVTEIKIAIDLCIGRDGRIDTGRQQEIQCDDSLGDKKVPAIWWELRIGDAKDGDKMVFEGLYRPLSLVGPVVSLGGQLVLKVLSFNVCDQFLGDFIVKSKELGA